VSQLAFGSLVPSSVSFLANLKGTTPVHSLLVLPRQASDGPWASKAPLAPASVVERTCSPKPLLGGLPCLTGAPGGSTLWALTNHSCHGPPLLEEDALTPDTDSLEHNGSTPKSRRAPRMVCSGLLGRKKLDRLQKRRRRTSKRTDRSPLGRVAAHDRNGWSRPKSGWRPDQVQPNPQMRVLSGRAVPFYLHTRVRGLTSWYSWWNSRLTRLSSCSD
jgi:hypothetical protein